MKRILTLVLMLVAAPAVADASCQEYVESGLEVSRQQCAEVYDMVDDDPCRLPFEETLADAVDDAACTLTASEYVNIYKIYAAEARGYALEVRR
jgi:hypothetical protein